MIEATKISETILEDIKKRNYDKKEVLVRTIVEIPETKTYEYSDNRISTKYNFKITISRLRPNLNIQHSDSTRYHKKYTTSELKKIITNIFNRYESDKKCNFFIQYGKSTVSFNNEKTYQVIMRLIGSINKSRSKFRDGLPLLHVENIHYYTGRQDRPINIIMRKRLPFNRYEFKVDFTKSIRDDNDYEEILKFIESDISKFRASNAFIYPSYRTDYYVYVSNKETLFELQIMYGEYITKVTEFITEEKERYDI